MKFSIQFKYNNVNFKNTKTKEVISFDTKAQDGNTFIFDNVDEDVIIGILKGVKDKKASSVFGYDDFRTNFINTMSRNKCKELYDKIDKEDWKVEDIVVSGITLKDLEFTKPTLNARENITVESKKKFNEVEAEYDRIDKKYNFNRLKYNHLDFRKGMKVHETLGGTRHGVIDKVSKFGHADVIWDDGSISQEPLYCIEPDKPRKWRHGFNIGDTVDLYEGDDYFYPNCRIIELSTCYGEPVIGVITADGKNYDNKSHSLNYIDPKYIFKPGESPMGDGENITVESSRNKGKNRINESDERIQEILNKLEEEYDEILTQDDACFSIVQGDDGEKSIEISIDPEGCRNDFGYNEAHLYDEIQEFVANLGCSIENEWKNRNNWGFYARMESEKDVEDPRQMKFAFENGETKMEQIDVIFKKDRRNKDIIAFFPDTMYDGSCNPGNLMSYAHIGQHSEASVDYYNMCRPATEEEYAPLLHELEQIYDDCKLNVVRKITRKHYNSGMEFKKQRGF